MSRLMAVSLTEDQVRYRTKTVTRRAGWLMLKPGDRLTLCRKVMGRRRGEPLVRIADVEVVAVRRERLEEVKEADVAAEGFPDMTPGQFVSFFCATHRGCSPGTEITRIEWRYLDAQLLSCLLNDRRRSLREFDHPATAIGYSTTEDGGFR